jgi:hypothetical protein
VTRRNDAHVGELKVLQENLVDRRLDREDHLPLTITTTLSVQF